MRSLVLITILSLAAAKPRPDGIWAAPASLSYVHQRAVAVAQPVVHAAPAVIAKPAATSYASFQQVVHPVSVAQPLYHAAPGISQPVYHAPIVSQPLVQAAPQPVVHSPDIYHPVFQSLPTYSQPLSGW